MQPLLHSRIELLESPQIRSFLTELCLGAEFPAAHEPCCTVDNLLVLVLQLHNRSLTLNHFPLPGSSLTFQMQQLNGSLHCLAREIAVNRGIQIGRYDGKAFLTFLKAAYCAPMKSRPRKVSQLRSFY